MPEQPKQGGTVGPSGGARVAPLREAQAALRRFRAVVDYATSKGEPLPPYQERALRADQDAMLQLAQSAALVAIAEALAEPHVRIAEPADGGDAETVRRLRELVHGQYWPADRVPLEHLVGILGRPGPAAGGGEVARDGG